MDIVRVILVLLGITCAWLIIKCLMLSTRNEQQANHIRRLETEHWDKTMDRIPRDFVVDSNSRKEKAPTEVEAHPHG